MAPKYPDVKVKLAGTDTDWTIMLKVKNALKRFGYEDAVKPYLEACFNVCTDEGPDSWDGRTIEEYEHYQVKRTNEVLAITQQWVEIE